MDLKTAGFRTKGLLKLDDGRQFRGQIHVNNVLRTQNDIADYLLQVSEKSFVQAGQAMLYQGKVFILGDGVDEFSRTALFKMLRMIEVNRGLLWTRNTEIEDSLTGLKKGVGVTHLGVALVSMLATHQISDAFHVNNSKYQLITNSLVQPDDRVGPYTITFVETRHGIQYAEAR